MIGIVISTGVLWFLISYFTRGTEGGAQKAFGIIMIVTVSQIFARIILVPFLGGFASLITLPILFFSIEWICDTTRRNTWWITCCYFVTMILIGLVSALLKMQVDA